MNEKIENSFNQEQLKTFKQKVENIETLKNGAISINFGAQEDIDGDHRGVLLTQEKMEEFNLTGRLMEGTEVEITTNSEGKLIKIEIIE